MKQYKLQKKAPDQSPSSARGSTRQEIDEIAKHIAGHIEKNPAKAARLFESWLNGKPKSQLKKKAA
jgi:hypothetical protein